LRFPFPRAPRLAAPRTAHAHAPLCKYVWLYEKWDVGFVFSIRDSGSGRGTACAALPGQPDPGTGQGARRCPVARCAAAGSGAAGCTGFAYVDCGWRTVARNRHTSLL